MCFYPFRMVRSETQTTNLEFFTTSPLKCWVWVRNSTQSAKRQCKPDVQADNAESI